MQVSHRVIDHFCPILLCLSKQSPTEYYISYYYIIWSIYAPKEAKVLDLYAVAEPHSQLWRQFTLLNTTKKSKYDQKMQI